MSFVNINAVSVLRGSLARLGTLDDYGLPSTGLDDFQFHNDSVMNTELGQYYYICP